MKNIIKNINIFFVFIIVATPFCKDINAQDYSYNLWRPVVFDSLRGIFGGYTRAIVIDETNPDILYAGTRDGGIFKSDNGGSYWHEKNNGLSNKNVLSMAIHPKFRNIIYVGTENGVFRSEDSGENWKLTGLLNCQVNSIVVDPESTNIIYAAVGRLFGVGTSLKGIWRNDKDGQSNSWIQYKLIDQEEVDVFTVKIYYDETRRIKRKIYAGTSKGIWISDDGKSWPDSTHDNDLITEQVFAFAIDPVPNHNNSINIYAGTKRGVTYSNNYGYYWHNWIYVPEDEWITSLALDSTFMYAGTKSGGIFKKTTSVFDTSWEKTGLPDTEIYSVQIDPIHPEIVYCANPNGVFRSSNFGNKFGKIVVGMTSPQITQFLINPSNYRRTIAATPNGSFLSKDHYWSWEQINDLPPTRILSLKIHPDKNSEIYAGMISDWIYNSTDSGSFWTKLSAPSSQDTTSALSIAVRSSDDCIFIGTEKNLYKSENKGYSWNSILSTNYPISVITINPNNDKKIYVGTSGGEVIRGTENNGWNWIEINTGLPAFEQINDIVVSPFNHESMFVSTGHGLYFSTNAGDSWQPVDDAWVKYDNITKVIFDTFHTGIMYALIEKVGIFQSDDYGLSWRPLNKNLDENRAIISYFSPHPDSTQILYASTQGRGLYRFHAAAEINPETDEVKFDIVPLGSIATKRIKTFNTGELPLIISNISPTAPSFSYTIDEYTINPHNYSNLYISYTPELADTFKIEYLIIKSNAIISEKRIKLIGIPSAADILIDKTLVNFDKVRINKEVKQGFKIKNKGNKAFNFTTKILKFPQNFSISPKEGVIYPGETISDTIFFKPTSDTFYQDIIRYTDDEIFLGDSLVHVSGEGIEGAYIGISDTSIIFNPVRPGGFDSCHVTIYNLGSETLNINDIICDPYSKYSVKPTTGQVPIDDSLKMTLIFSSDLAGKFIGYLTIISNASHGNNTIKLFGECVSDAPIIIISPKELNFDSVRVNTSKIDSVKVTNTGQEELIIDTVNWKDPTIKVDPNTSRVPVDDSMFFKVTYTPSDTIILKDTLEFVTNNAVGEKKVALNGVGIAPLIMMEDSLFIGPTLVDSTSEKTLVIKNTGSSTLQLKTKITGQDSFAFECKDSVHIIAHSYSDSIRIKFTANANRNFYAQLKLVSDEFFHGDSLVELIGIGFSGPFIEIIPNSANFEKVRVGKDSSKLFAISNRGDETLNINSIIKNFITSDYIYSVSIADSLVLKNNSTTMTVTFHPDTIKSYPENLLIRSNALYGDSTVFIKGEGKAPFIQVVPNTRIPFGLENPDSSEIGSIEVKNVGNDTLIIFDVFITQNNTVFVLGPNYVFPDKIPSDSISIYNILFTPDTIDTFGGILTIHSDALNEKLYDISLSGEGYDIIPPSIKPVKIDSIESGVVTNVSANITDNLSGVEHVELIHRMGGDINYDTVKVMNSIAPDSFWWNLSGDQITTRGLEYKIKAFDYAGNWSNSPSNVYHSIPIFILGEGESKKDTLDVPVPQPAGIDSQAYRMISIPLKLYKNHPNDVLLDDLDSYNEEKWRFADYKYPQRPHPNCYVFLSNTEDISHFEPGKAFFLIVKDKNKIIDSGPGISIKTDATYEIPLRLGWNLIGNPFNFNVPLSQLILSSNHDLMLLTYYGRWDTLGKNYNSKILPWDGYAIYNYVTDEKLIVYPSQELLPSSQGTRVLNKNSNFYDWTIQIIAKCKQAEDVLNYVGVSTFAKTNYDKYDLPEPPGIGHFVMVYMPHNDWQEKSNCYTIDIQSVSEEGNFWDFEVLTNIFKSPIKLEFVSSDKLPVNFKLHFIDRDLKIAKDINKSQTYSFISGSDIQSKRRFRLIVGTENYIDVNSLGLSSIPDEYFLSQNFPNPFNPSTAIYYNLPENAEVKIQIYNILGQLVKTLISNELQTPGTHVLIWDGTDNHNNPVTSGLYLCKMKCKNFADVRKLILLK